MMPRSPTLIRREAQVTQCGLWKQVVDLGAVESSATSSGYRQQPLYVTSYQSSSVPLLHREPGTAPDVTRLRRLLRSTAGRARLIPTFPPTRTSTISGSVIVADRKQAVIAQRPGPPAAHPRPQPNVHLMSSPPAPSEHVVPMAQLSRSRGISNSRSHDATCSSHGTHDTSDAATTCDRTTSRQASSDCQGQQSETASRCLPPDGQSWPPEALLPQTPPAATPVPDPGRPRRHGDADTNHGDTIRARGPAPMPQHAGRSLLSQALCTAGSTPPAPFDGAHHASLSPDESPEQHNSGPTTPTNTPLVAQGARLASSRPPEPDTDVSHERPQTPVQTCSCPSSSAMAAPLAPSLAPSMPALRGRDLSKDGPTMHQNMLTTARDILSNRQHLADRVAGHRASIHLETGRQLSRSPDLPLRSTSPDDPATPTRATFFEARQSILPSRPSENGSAESLMQQQQHQHHHHHHHQWGRPRLGEHRSAAPEKTEKIWSIGSGESCGEGGQVEKSVAEAMAGVEHNARSRKASYSLRFFKEGMPADDQVRRKDAGKSSRRDKPLPPTIEDDEPVARTKPTDDLTREPTTTADEVLGQSEQTRSRSFPVYTSIIPGQIGEPKDTDYSALASTSSAGRSTPSSTRSQPHSTAETNQKLAPELGPGTTFHSEGVEGHPRSHGKVGESAREDMEADESGEEKISSAVFVPHHEATESQSSEGEARSPCRVSRHRSLSQSKKLHWLVKADEPEPEPERDDGDQEEDSPELHARPEPPAYRRGKPSRERASYSAVDVESEVERAAGTRVTLPVPRTEIHDHQHSLQQPLEAIELIPYKHQVGGHTTLWRFSRRAVCKQLNNRENEFYETIEKYHRELLPFLPRYVQCPLQCDHVDFAN